MISVDAEFTIHSISKDCLGDLVKYTNDKQHLINNLEDLRVKLEVMGSNMTDKQFTIQVLNSLTGNYELQQTLHLCMSCSL
jgi:hypothetical protein